MKKLKIIILFSILMFISSCIIPDEPDCNERFAFKEELISISPIQSQYRVNDVLNIAAILPSQNNFFGEELNLFNLTSNTRAAFLFGESLRLIEDQDLIIIKGSRDGNNFVADYNMECDCYEFEADLILSEVREYNVILSNLFDVKGDGCDIFTVETSAPWINFPNQIEFEVVP